MNRTKYRVWLISLALAAVLLGIVWYAAGREEEKTITDGDPCLAGDERTGNGRAGFG